MRTQKSIQSYIVGGERALNIGQLILETNADSYAKPNISRRTHRLKLDQFCTWSQQVRAQNHKLLSKQTVTAQMCQIKRAPKNIKAKANFLYIEIISIFLA